MHYLQQYRAQRTLDEAEARARGAEREEVDDIQLVNKARKVGWVDGWEEGGGRRGRCVMMCVI